MKGILMSNENIPQRAININKHKATFTYNDLRL